VKKKQLDLINSTGFVPVLFLYVGRIAKIMSKMKTNFELTREEKCDIINTVVRGRRKDLENRE